MSTSLIRRLALVALGVALIAGCTPPNSPAEGAKQTKQTKQPGALAPGELAGLVDKHLATHKSVKITIKDDKGKPGTLSLNAAKGLPEMSMAETPGSPDLIALQDKVYMKLGDKDTGQKGRPWVAFPRGSNAPGAKEMNGMVKGLLTMIDSKQRNKIMASGTVTKADKEADGGTRYFVTADLAKALTSVDQKAFLRENGAILGEGLKSEFTQVLGSDEDAHLIKLADISDADAAKLMDAVKKAAGDRKVNFQLKLDSQKTPVAYTFFFNIKDHRTEDTFEYSDWGKVTLEAPPAGQIAKS